MEYQLGKIYASSMLGPVIYRGHSSKRNRHSFELKYIAGAMRYEGTVPTSGKYSDNLSGYAGKISECSQSAPYTRYAPGKDMGQSKKWSLVETIFGVIIGFIVALLIQLVIFPLFGITTSFGENFTIAGIFTIASIIRGYSVRRFFSWLRHVKGIGG